MEGGEELSFDLLRVSSEQHLESYLEYLVTGWPTAGHVGPCSTHVGETALHSLKEPLENGKNDVQHCDIQIVFNKCLEFRLYKEAM